MSVAIKILAVLILADGGHEKSNWITDEECRAHVEWRLAAGDARSGYCITITSREMR